MFFYLSTALASNLPHREFNVTRQSGWYRFASADHDVLKCISFNTWGLPISLHGHDQKDRFERMPDSLLNVGADILCLQETFHPVLRNGIINKLTADYYFKGDYRCDQSVLGIIQKDCRGGLMTFSKFPVVSEEFYPFPSIEGISIVEKIGAKGFLFSVIDMDGKKLNIVNTHLYAGEDQNSEHKRLQQILFMKKKLAEIPEYYLFPTILMGDLNTTHPTIISDERTHVKSEIYPILTSDLDFADSCIEVCENDFTYNGKLNYYIKSKANLQKLDYCMFKNQKGTYKLQLLSQSLAFHYNSFLSDHFGLRVEFKINNNDFLESIDEFVIRY